MKEKIPPRGRKKPENELSFTIPSLSANESTARSVVSVFVSQLNPTISELSDIKCAVSEAVTNCIVHGYRNTLGIISIKIRIFPERTVHIEIKDKGCGIDNIPQAMEPLFTTDDSGERSGMGFAVMQNFMDGLTVKSAAGKGTTVTMSKKLSPLSPHIKSERQNLFS